MTVQTNTNVASFNGNGVTQIFPIAFKFNNDTDLVVLLVDDATGAVSQLALNSDYTVSGEGDEDGGLINVVVAPAAGQRLKVTRLVDILQLTDLRNQGKFFAEVHEDALDLLTMIAQQHESGIRSSLRVAESDQEPQRLPAAASRANMLLSFDSSGNPIVVAPASGDASALAVNLSNTEDPLKGAGQVGFKRTDLATAITTVGGMLSAQWRNIWEYAALAIKPDPLDISTWDWQPAIQAAVDALPQALYLPPLSGNGVYYTESPVVVDGPVVLVGSHCKRMNTAGGTRVENRGSGDCITYSNTKAIYDAGIKNLGLTATSGGSPLRVKYGAVRCHFTQLYLYSKDTNQPCVKADFSAGAFGVDFAGMYSCVFDGGEYIVDNVARTSGIVDMFANATVINENEFKNIWITQAKGRPAIRLLCTVNGPLLTNNRFSGLTFEICSGGLIQIQGTSHTKISGCSGWDTTAGYDGSLIQISGDTTKSQNRGLLIENFARVGNDPLNGSSVDIVLGYSRDTTIINHSPNSGAGAIIDASARTAVIIGAPNATVVNGAAVTLLQGGAVTAPEFSTKTGNKVRDVTGGVDLHAPAGTSGLGSVNGASSQRVYLDANTFFGGNGAFLPATDNLLNLGHTTNRFKTIYAGTGTINTSDAREKQEVRELSETERAVAVRLKGLLRCFKFNDAVALKGENARIHCGVIAQDVKAAFEAEGLVAERYAILCYDEWPEQVEVVTDEGEVVTPHRPAGNRYGVRYEELLAFIVSAI